jgi:hypothetical protein
MNKKVLNWSTFWKRWLFVCLCCCSMSAFAQQRVTVTGFVYDEKAKAFPALP